MMHFTRALRRFGYGVSFAVLLALATPGVPGNETVVALAQDAGQPGARQIPTPNPLPEPAAGSGQQPGILVPVSAAFVPGLGGPEGGVGTELIDEGGDIGEGLSNQRVDPDD